MSEPQPNPRVSNKISPLAVIVVIILVGIVIVAFVKRHGHHETPGGMKAPMAAPSNAVMPQQPNLPNGMAPRANTNDAMEAAPTGNEEGNPKGTGPGNGVQ